MFISLESKSAIQASAPCSQLLCLSSSPFSLGFYCLVGTCRSQGCAGSNFNWAEAQFPHAASSQHLPLWRSWWCSCKSSPELMWGWCTMWDGRSDTANEGNQLLQPELESKGGNDSETHEYMVLTKALPEISLSWKIELWWLQRVRMIASVTMLQELYKEQPKQFRH